MLWPVNIFVTLSNYIACIKPRETCNAFVKVIVSSFIESSVSVK